MEECEALCHRLGTPQHLKSRFGKGYQLDVTFESRASVKEREQLKINAEEELKRHFSVRLIESSQHKATFELVFEFEKDGAMTLAQMFRMMENLKQKLSIVSYALNQTTLEQIFVRMAQLSCLVFYLYLK
ncbi:hypothetical protein RFI_27586 [Reticulomyxa filosa]|uniref:Uncharacterized protein n=1 Tax=Reticulomyxa filosa TaxID=46433 RepID=X6M827_RETFI|nr:hypothetical protein RFI_27586 [Reticulomyxa filosa]|eukprot:ETO09791.1 hypothetical protein RFI_27586 [Reticulomyxa filosa]